MKEKAFKCSPDESISVDGNFTQIIGYGYLLILYQHQCSASAAAHMKSNSLVKILKDFLLDGISTSAVIATRQSDANFKNSHLENSLCPIRKCSGIIVQRWWFDLWTEGTAEPSVKDWTLSQEWIIDVLIVNAWFSAQSCVCPPLSLQGSVTQILVQTSQTNSHTSHAASCHRAGDLCLCS